MVKYDNQTIIIIVVVAAIVLFFCMRCRITCGNEGYENGTVREGYVRATLGNQCYGLQRTPVDYAMKNPNGWQRNPHYRAYPGDEHQPLEFGPIDFYSDTRRLNENNGVLFQQYRQDWGGCGKDIKTLANDSKNRFNLTNIGAQGMRNQLDNMPNPRNGFGFQFNEQTFSEPNPTRGPIYGGQGWLHETKIGN